MQYMFFVVAREDQPIPDALLDAMGGMIEREMKSGGMLDVHGLQPAARGARLNVRGGKIDVTAVDSKEVISGYATFQFNSHDEAMAKAAEFMNLYLQHAPDWEGTCEVRLMDEFEAD